MSDAPISDKEYQQARRKAILRRGMNRAVPKTHPGDIGLPDVPAFDGQGRIDGGTLPDGTEQMPFTAGMIDMEDGSFRVEEITMRSLSFPEPPTVISFYGTGAWNRASGGLTERAQPAKLPTLNGS
jgi:hypothetical protein